MITDSIAKISAAAVITISTQLATPQAPHLVLSSHEISLQNRYPVQSVSDVFKDNILLNLAYLRGSVASKQDINWDEIRQPFEYEFRLDPDQTFAFHDDMLDKYRNSLVKTTQAHFNAAEGFKTDGYLYGDGVCHLASLIYWVAKEALLDANAPVSHDFMAIPQIAKEHGVSIYSNPYIKGANAQQNLYITNNRDKAVMFKFEYSGDKLKVSLLEGNF